MSRSFFAMGAAAMLSAAAAQGAINWTVSYEADVTPEAASSISYSLGGTDSFSQSGAAGTSSATGGIYSFSTLGGNNGAFFHTPTESVKVSLNSDTGYTVEWRARITGADTPGIMNAAAIQVDEGRAGIDRFWDLELINSDGAGGFDVVLTNTIGNYVAATIDNTNFHTYRVTVLSTGATLYIDDNPTPIGTLATFRALGTNNFRFGDFSGGEDAAFETDYIRIFDGGAVAPVPEPAAMSLIGLGALVLRRRK